MDEKTAPPPCLPPAYVEVRCKTSDRTYRFVEGIDAKSAVYLINRKLNVRNAKAVQTYTEAIKEGEQPIAFGPDAVLVDFGNGWKLQTYTEADEVAIEGNHRLLTEAEAAALEDYLEPMLIRTPAARLLLEGRWPNQSAFYTL